LDLELKGLRALLLGSSRGIGLACAQRLAAEGCDVALHGRDVAALEAARRSLARPGGPAVHGFAAELADPAAMAALVARALESLGGLEILVVNTGHLPYGGFAAHDDAAWQHAFDLVVMSAVRVVRAALPALRQARPGRAAIVFIGSASTREPKLHLLSNALRAAVAGLAKTLAQELAVAGIRVNTVAPGYIASGRVARRMAEMEAAGMAHEEAARSVAGAALPLGRLGGVEEVADLVALLASRRGGYVNGATLAADGGLNRAVF
jgi:3-oxoacyl-[acyl-carrier protein] reductase